MSVTFVLHSHIKTLLLRLWALVTADPSALSPTGPKHFKII